MSSRRYDLNDLKRRAAPGFEKTYLVALEAIREVFSDKSVPKFWNVDRLERLCDECVQLIDTLQAELDREEREDENR